MRKEVQIKFSEGLHARPAANFVREAAKFKSIISLEWEGRLANGKSILAVMALGVGYDDKIAIIAEGEDEADAIMELSKFVRNA